MKKKNLRIILMVELSRPTGRQLVRGIIKYSRLHGPWSFYFEQLWIKNQINKVKDWNADVVVVHCDDYAMLKRIDSLKLPTIGLIGIYQKKFPHFHEITGNNIRIGQIAAEYFIRRGYTHFAYCGADLPTQWSTERAKGFEQHILNHSKKSTFSAWQPKRIPKWDLEQVGLAEWIVSLPKPLAMFCCNDERGQHILNACKTADIKVPFEVAVLGVDNDDILCNLSDPTLSSINMNFEKAGFSTGELISEIVNGSVSGKQTIIIEPLEVETRVSTEITAIQDKDVLLALQYIKEHIYSQIQVSEVAEHIGITERGLLKKFKRTIGSTISEEINRLRIEEFSRLLVHTDMTLWEIAEKLGFYSLDNVSRYFQNQTGMSPGHYRKLHRGLTDDRI